MFPKRYLGTRGPRLVVEFESEHTGTVIESSQRVFHVGIRKTNWASCYIEDTWQPLESKRQKLHNMVKGFK